MSEPPQTPTEGAQGTSSLGFVGDERAPHRRSSLDARPPWHYALLLIPAVVIPLLQCRALDGVDSFGFTPHYLNLAQSMIEHGAYVERLGGKLVPVVEREPMYPAALVLAHALFGNFDALLTAQCIALMASYFLWGVMALRQTSGWAGWVAAAILYALLLADPQPGFYASVLYPYAFQGLLMTLAIFFLASAMDPLPWYSGGGLGWGPAAPPPVTGSSAHGPHLNPPPEYQGRKQRWLIPCLLTAGILAGLAMYERGAYLVLPVFIATALFLIRKPVGLRLRHVLLFVLPALLVPLPWLIRNRMLGASGMNQMSGYTLGFTYGNLKPHPRDDFERNYEASVKARGTDTGTMNFIREQADAGVGTYAQIDSRVARYVLAKMHAHPRDVWRQVRHSLAAFGQGLCTPGFEHLTTNERSARQVWRQLAARSTSPADILMLAFGLAGVALLLIDRSTRPQGAIFVALLVYTVLFSTLIVKFDARYRGVVEPMLFYAAAYAVIRAIPRGKADNQGHKIGTEYPEKNATQARR